MTKREKNQQRRFFTKKDGVKPDSRKDFKNDKVIINEKRVKKVSRTSPSFLHCHYVAYAVYYSRLFLTTIQNDRYLASQLPHQYESRAQYERSLRLPMGPEFMTKQAFQDATKPRVIIKQGIIAPISKPTH